MSEVGVAGEFREWDGKYRMVHSLFAYRPQTSFVAHRMPKDELLALANYCPHL